MSLFKVAKVSRYLWICRADLSVLVNPPQKDVEKTKKQFDTSFENADPGESSQVSSPVVNNSKVAEVKETVSQYHPSPGLFRFYPERLKEGKPKLENPIIKSLAVGKVNNKLFEYPEFDSKDDLQSSIDFANLLDTYLKETISSKTLPTNDRAVSKHVLQTLRFFGLFGLEIPGKYGGLNLDAKKLLRVYETIAARDLSLLAMISAHNNLAVKAVLLFGNDDQKQKYLPRLASGELIGAFCLTEPDSGMDAAMMETRADPSSDSPTYVLRGTKSWVTNAAIADLFIVFAKSKSTSTINLSSAFIVERDFGGITVGEPRLTVGLRQTNFADVKFDGTAVPALNLLGQEDDGHRVALLTTSSNLYTSGAVGASIIKPLLQNAGEQIADVKRFNKDLIDMESVRGNLSTTAINAYTMESMAFLTAGIMDDYDCPDLTTESTAVRMFTNQHLFRSIDQLGKLYGAESVLESSPILNTLNDVRTLLWIEGNPEMLRFLVAFSTLQYVGQNVQDVARKMRKPLDNPNYILRMLFSWYTRDKPKMLGLDLAYEFHPTLRDSADMLEELVSWIEHYGKKMLITYAEELVDRQFMLDRYAEAVCGAFAVMAVLSRASRAKAIGLPGHDHEIRLAKLFTFKTVPVLKKQLDEIKLGTVISGDDWFGEVGKGVFKHRGWAAAHPSSRNW